MGDLPPLLFPPLSAPPTLIALNSALLAASLDPPSGTAPQVRIGGEWVGQTRGRIRWELGIKGFQFHASALRACGEGSVLGWG